jgi:hypothetical protein
MIIPLIQKIEKTKDKHNKLCPGVVDLVLFDGASKGDVIWHSNDFS